MATHSDPLSARLSELLAKATVQPWRSEDTNSARLSLVCVSEVDGSNNCMCTVSQIAGPDREANAALIVEAINALPTLLAERAILIAREEEARALLESSAGVLGELIEPDMSVRAVDVYFRAKAAESAARAYLTRTKADG